MSIAAAGSVLAQNTFHGNLARTGVYAKPGPAVLTGVKWAFKAGGAIVSSPSIADGVVYIGSLDGHLYAIALADGPCRATVSGSGWMRLTPRCG